MSVSRTLSATPAVSGLILAAGASSRMGCAKALLPIAGEPQVLRLTSQLLSGGCDRVALVIGGQWAADVRAVAGSHPKVDVVVNPRPERGMLSSLREGIVAMPTSTAVMFTPVDLPLMTPTPIAALIARAQQLPSEFGGVIVPEFAGRGGHPALVMGAAVEALRRATDDQTPREVLAGFARDAVVTDDPGVRGNMNTPEDARGWRARLEAPEA